MKTLRLFVIAVVFSFGLSAFIPSSAFACGGTWGSGCKTADVAPLALALTRSIASMWGVVMP